MKEIELTQNRVALVDSEDYKWLNKWKWHTHKGVQTYYAARKKGNKLIFMHRTILNTPDGKDTDHKDSNGLNNQKYNIRVCTRQGNCMNRRSRQNSSSIYKGCYWAPKDQRWRAQIRFNNEKKCLGSFIYEIDAASAYDKAAKQLHGEFARLNFN